MKIRRLGRAWVAAFATASTVAAIAGCSSARLLSTPQPAGGDDSPKKEYQWKDLSTGKSFFKPIDPSTKD